MGGGDDQDDGAERLRNEMIALHAAIRQAAEQIEAEKQEIARQKAAVFKRPVAYVTAHNERIKYTATLINTVAAGCVVAGFIGPLTAYMAGAGVQLSSVANLSVWLLIGLGLHLGVRALLGRLRE